MLLAAVALAGCVSLPQGRQVIDRIEVQGAGGVSEGAIQEKIATAESPRFLGLWEGVVFDYEVLDPYVLERDLGRVERLYRARGYYEARARVARVVTTKPGHVEVTIVVDEGGEVVVGEVKIPGLTTIPLDDAAKVLSAVRRKVRPGRVLDEDNFAAAEEAAKKALTDRGYPYASVKGEVEVDLVRHVADVTFTASPGVRATFGAITIDGLGNIPDAPVRRTLDLTPGDEYSTAAIESAQRSAMDLGVFGAVVIVPDLSHPEATVVPVNVHVEPAKLQAVKVGGGIELDVIRTDVHAETGWESRNFLGGLRRLSFTLRPGIVLFPTRLPGLEGPTNVFFEEKAQAELRQPGFIEARTQGIVRGAFNVYPVIVAGQQADGAVYGYREIKGAAGVDRVLGLFYSSLFYNTQTNIPFIEAHTDTPLPQVDLSYLDWFVSFDLRNDPVKTRRGLYISQDTQVASPALRGKVSDVRLQPEIRGYLPISRRVTFALKGTLGLLFPGSYSADTEGTSDLDEQIAFFRAFFSGGPSSNRGYPFRGIGPWGPVRFLFSPFQTTVCSNLPPGQAPPDTCKTPVGGSTLWETSAEVRFPIAGEFSGSTFCDASDVAAGRGQFRFDHPHLSCGIGLRYGTPVGPIRLDVGYRLPGLQITNNFDDRVDVDPNDCSLPGMCVFQLPIAFGLGIGEAF